MSSGSNYSGSQLRRIYTARYNTLFKELAERLKAQQTRLHQRPDQTGVLTIEQKNLNERVSVVHKAFGRAISLFFTVELFLDYYDQARQNVQPEHHVQIIALIVDQENPLDQIATKIADVGVKLQNLEVRLLELEGIDINDALSFYLSWLYTHCDC